MTKQQQTDCLVIGGGIVGLCCARALAIAGLRTVLIDGAIDNVRTSWAAGGILSSLRPWAESTESLRWSLQGRKLYPGLVAELYAETAIDAQFWQCGLWMLATKDALCTQHWAAENQQICITRTQAEEIPAGIPLTEAAVFLPEVAQVRVPLLLQALTDSLQRHQVATISARVEDFRIAGGRCVAATTSQGDWRAAQYIVCTGAWSSDLFAGVIQTEPVRGQMLCLHLPVPPCSSIILEGEYYLIPRRDGHILLGSTMEKVGFDAGTTVAARERLLTWGKNRCPALKQATVLHHWAGLRPASKRNSPWCERLPDASNIWVNTGHFRKGILQAPACAEYIANSLMTD